MPLAVTHVLLTIVAVDLYRDYFTKHKKYFTLNSLLIAGIAGLLPDIDVPLNWVLSILGYSSELFKHGGITHTLIFGLIFLIPGFYFLKKEKHKTATIFFIIAFGITFHLVLDYIIGGGAKEGIKWFWPFYSGAFKIHLISKIGLDNLPYALDAFILLGWLWHEQAKHKIIDFI